MEKKKNPQTHTLCKQYIKRTVIFKTEHSGTILRKETDVAGTLVIKECLEKELPD